MTYLELKQMIESLRPERQNMDVTVYNSDVDEYFPVEDFLISNASFDDRLDHGHPYLTIYDSYRTHNGRRT